MKRILIFFFFLFSNATTTNQQQNINKKGTIILFHIIYSRSKSFFSSYFNKKLKSIYLCVYYKPKVSFQKNYFYFFC
jgi:hypothetical protein